MSKFQAQHKQRMTDYDYLIIGTGFGGSAAALRLAEKGWKVGMVEQGRRLTSADLRAGKSSLFKLMWMPALKMRGYFVQHMFRHVAIVGGVGVGGGSIVWAAVQLEPKEAFYADPKLAALDLNLKAELAPHLATARRMLGVATNPRQSEQDHYLRQTAERMEALDTFGPVPNAIFFGKPGEEGKTLPDPFFGGDGPARTACTFCSGCMTGCDIGAKNSLDWNYLYLAEREGVQVLPERKAERIEPVPGGGYRVTLVDAFSGRELQILTAKNVVLSAGVVGSLELLFKNRDHHKTLPNVSPTLGRVVRTNSEAITAVLQPKGQDMTDGASISTDFHPDAVTHATQNRFDRGYRFMRFYFGPLVDDPLPWRRALKTLGKAICSPRLLLSNVLDKEWEKRITAFTIMQDKDNYIGLEYRRPWWKFWGAPMLLSATAPGHEAPTYLPIANQLTREYAKASGGVPMNLLMESVGNQSSTAHILCGAPMGLSAADGVIDTRHEVHGHPGLFVCDGASIPGNIGVNPSLTITAMAERFAALQAAAAAQENA